jgi:hypothetical protein
MCLYAISSLCERVLTQAYIAQYRLIHTYAIWYSLLLLGYKPVQHVTVLNTAGSCNTVVSIIILYYNIMGPPSYMRSVLDRNVVMRRINIYGVLIEIELTSDVDSNRRSVCRRVTSSTTNPI